MTGARIVVAPAPFKGVLTALEAAEAIARGVRAAGSEAVVVPVADGGAGTLDALIHAGGGTVMGVIARGPMGIPVRAHLGRLPDGTGVIEMAQASGLGLVAERERDPMRATSHGTGELIKGALARRPPRIVVGLGDSATVDGGTGLARAIGMRFLDEHGRELPPGGAALERLDKIDPTGLDPRLGGVALVAAADVDAPLAGPAGAARMYGEQKGALPHQIETLERGLVHLGERLAVDLGTDVAELPGAGAAGGTGAMLAALGAELRPGAELVVDAVGLAAKLAGASLVVTGEGRFDDQTLAGKAPSVVARTASEAGVPCVALVGDSIRLHPAPFDEVRTLVEQFEGDRARAMREAAAGLASMARALVRDRE